MLHADHRSQESLSALRTKRQACQDEVTSMCCENHTCKKARLMQNKKGGTTLVCIFCYACFLISCIYARVLCILDCCFDDMSLLLISHVSAKSILYLIVLWSADRTVYLQIESETVGRESVILPGIVIAPTS